LESQKRKSKKKGTMQTIFTNLHPIF
jgi:hypothetical protein